MGIFLKPGEKPTPGKTIIRIRDPKGTGRWKNDIELWQFISTAHFLNDCRASLKTIADVCRATVEEVKSALKCERPKWGLDGRRKDPE